MLACASSSDRSAALPAALRSHSHPRGRGCRPGCAEEESNERWCPEGPLQAEFRQDKARQAVGQSEEGAAQDVDRVRSVDSPEPLSRPGSCNSSARRASHVFPLDAGHTHVQFCGRCGSSMPERISSNPRFAKSVSAGSMEHIYHIGRQDHGGGTAPRSCDDQNAVHEAVHTHVRRRHRMNVAVGCRQSTVIDFT